MLYGIQYEIHVQEEAQEGHDDNHCFISLFRGLAEAHADEGNSTWSMTDTAKLTFDLFVERGLNPKMFLCEYSGCVLYECEKYDANMFLQDEGHWVIDPKQLCRVHDPRIKEYEHKTGHYGDGEPIQPKPLKNVLREAMDANGLPLPENHALVLLPDNTTLTFTCSPTMLTEDIIEDLANCFRHKKQGS